MARTQALTSIVILAIAISACDRSLPTAPSSTNAGVTTTSTTVEGRISSFTGTNASFQLVTEGKVIAGDAATAFDSGSRFNELSEGIAVRVDVAQRPDLAYATRVTITSPSTAFNGRILVKASTPSQIELMLANGSKVMVGSLTDIRRNGEPQNANALADGQTIAVNGRQKDDGTVAASVVQILADVWGGSFYMTTTIGNVTGASPVRTITTKSGYTIHTTPETTFSGTTCSALAAGDRVEIEGIVQQDSSVSATVIRKI